ncbi:porin, partial [Cupriavidus consociatus]|uniref:porin n=1 Tax=Cupriavidus consociatus TaxID=2821357 RepID=UPI001AE6DE55
RLAQSLIDMLLIRLVDAYSNLGGLGRWGLRGAEDLGSGRKAIFTLESGFSYDTGKSGQQGQLFGRQAWLGMSDDKLGTVKVGRQLGATYNFIAEVDPIFTGGFTEILWEDLLTGLRFDNSVTYANSWGGLSVNAQYSFGEQAGNAARGRTIELSTLYRGDNFTLGGAGQQSRDASGNDLTLWSAGGKYSLGNVSLHAYYIDSRRDAGFVVGASGTTAPLANTSIGSNANTVLGPNTQTSERHDRVAIAGVGYQLTPAWRLTAAYMRDNVAGASRGASGLIQTAYMTAMYSLSKRTDMYIEADRSWLGGASVTDPNSPIGTFGGASTRTGLAMGMRTRF